MMTHPSNNYYFALQSLISFTQLKKNKSQISINENFSSGNNDAIESNALKM